MEWPSQVQGCSHYTTRSKIDDKECFLKYIELEDDRSVNIQEIVAEIMTYAFFDTLDMKGCAAGCPRYVRTCNNQLCQINQLIPGQDLHTVLSSPDRSLRVDEISYGENFLATLAIRPEDAKPRNFMLKPDGQLVSIDHEMGLFRKRDCISALFALPNFHTSINPNVVDKFFTIAKNKSEWGDKIEKTANNYRAVIKEVICDVMPEQQEDVMLDQQKNANKLIDEIKIATLKKIDVLEKIHSLCVVLGVNKQYLSENGVTYHLLFNLLVTPDNFRAADKGYSTDYQGTEISTFLECADCKKSVDLNKAKEAIGKKISTLETFAAIPILKKEFNLWLQADHSFDWDNYEKTELECRKIYLSIQEGQLKFRLLPNKNETEVRGTIEDGALIDPKEPGKRITIPKEINNETKKQLEPDIEKILVRLGHVREPIEQELKRLKTKLFGS